MPYLLWHKGDVVKRKHMLGSSWLDADPAYTVGDLFQVMAGSDITISRIDGKCEANVDGFTASGDDVADTLALAILRKLKDDNNYQYP
jgi:hypothetical protein